MIKYRIPDDWIKYDAKAILGRLADANLKFPRQYGRI